MIPVRKPSTSKLMGRVAQELPARASALCGRSMVKFHPGPNQIPLIVSFRFCTVELHRDREVVITRFADGTEAHARPHNTPEYHAHAVEKAGADDILLYCWQHDLMHVIVGEMNGGPSLVLWAVAHGEPTDTPECELEESQAQDLQRVLQMKRPEAARDVPKLGL